MASSSLRAVALLACCGLLACAEGPPGGYAPSLQSLAFLSDDRLAGSLPPTDAADGEATRTPLRRTAAVQDGGHSYFLVAAGLGLSLALLLAFAVMGVAVAAAFLFEVQIPLLGAMPTASSALLVLQLLSTAGQLADAPGPLANLGSYLVWALPSSADASLAGSVAVLSAVWLLRRTAVRQHQRENGTAPEPHSLAPGAWELRAAGLLAFPLAAASAGMLSGDTSLPLLGALAALVVMFGLAHHVLLALKFVTAAFADRGVVRTELPDTAGGMEIFVDATCNQLRALPVTPPQPGCPTIFQDWLASPGWCVAPAVAFIQEVEQRGSPLAQEGEVGGAGPFGQWATGGLWCSIEDPGAVREPLEDEAQGRPLLVSTSRSDASDASSDAEPEPHATGSRSPRRGWARHSPVALKHPVRIRALATFEVKTHDLIAGVACIPWLDCAVPAGVLRRIQEVAGDIELSVHPGQLSGPITSGRFAVCFDWGTRWPWRWPAEVALKAALGMWASAPLGGAPGLLAAVSHLLMLGLAGAFSYGAMTLRPYAHSTDNFALAAASLATTLVVLLRSLGDGLPGLAFMLAAAVAVLSAFSFIALLLAAVGLAGAVLGRLQAQGGFHDSQQLSCAISGWGGQSERSMSNTSSGAAAKPGGHAVEVILPGQRKTFAIVLPAMAQPRVVHAQLLPAAGQGGSPETLPSCGAGERARLPLPPGLLFSQGRDAPGGDKPGRPILSTPLVALLAPGRPGQLIYPEAVHNSGGSDWRGAVADFFGASGELLVEEAQHLVEGHVSSAEEASGSTLVVIEVLPTLAAEFMDERQAPP